MAVDPAWTAQLTPAQYRQISELLHEVSGIALGESKAGLVKARLGKRLRALRLPTFDDYLNYVQQDRAGTELEIMIDELTTNKTSFFREPAQFAYMRATLFPQLAASGARLRFWCAGCSSGEEPYSLGMALRDELPDIDRRDVRILATDISRRMLEVAQAAHYSEESIRDVPPAMLQHYFVVTGGPGRRRYHVKPAVRQLVTLAWLNLQESWPMPGPFDVIFCRNVMIYFDRPARQRLVQRYWELLRPGGHFFAGQTESLSGITHSFRYVQPAVYVKDEGH